MIIEIFLFIFLGILIGTFTGLTPGIHVNLISLFLLSLSGSILLKINSIYLIVLLVSMAITHTFIDFIPSVFFGCPDTDTELSALPGHDLLKQGRGYEAILLTIYGSLAAIFLLIILAPISIFLIKRFFPFIKNLIPYILIFFSIILILLPCSTTWYCCTFQGATPPPKCLRTWVPLNFTGQSSRYF